MQDSFFSFLSSPINLLFLFVAFFLLFVTPWLWSMVNSTHNIHKLLDLIGIKKKENSRVVNGLLLLPLLLITIFIEWLWPLANITLFPILASPYIKFNIIAVISVIILLILIQFDKKKSMGLWVLAYAAVLYLLYLIIIMATVVVGMNTFPASHYIFAPESSMTINRTIIYGLLIAHLIFIWLTISLKFTWRLLLMILYTLALSFAYFSLIVS
ncbi:TPA: hypothetical protein JBC15_08695 [Legionella pneumophila subsp. pneumophila]|uniref:hypothetical protein n=1 Tax=Legionella pneumophila TaxID=446 RepID=UPI00077AE349|nr:hypothetical protein [Legionella pneumophila]HAT9214208.1 hypothetical protein [Legionella pneumophila subsp. pneumophila]HAT9260524.1 hypothetical protein [Legionella pneumophila subsp. pneumophila]HAT9282694.1 hypothetical protein [Legionella pneumophila subsp. pneumophila]HAT9288612.1 hypothetical protein [Legionella pneumophila subsp. pneumophila]HAT9305655.1 hypothetical protein [Legionella pneumophila subsp. pneumophila]